MNHPEKTAPRLALVVSASLLAAGLGCGGDDEVADPCPACDLARIEGTVTSAGRPFTGSVQAEEASGGSDRRVSTECDSLGRYVLFVPPGRWLVAARRSEDTWFWSDREITRHEPAATPVEVAERSLASGIDFRFGALRFVIHLPRDLVGAPIDCHLYRYGRTLSRAVSAAEEVFVFDGVIGSGLQVFLDLDGETIWLPGTYYVSHAASFDVAAGEEVAYTMRISPAAEIRGTVRGVWEEYRVGRPVVAAVDRGEEWVAAAEVSDSGAYAIRMHATTTVNLALSWGGAMLWHGGASSEDATEYRLDAGMRFHGVDFEQRGLLVHTDGAPALDPDFRPRLTLYSEDLRRRVASVGLLVGEDILLPCLGPGAYRLFLEDAGDWGTGRSQWQWWPHTPFGGRAIPIEIQRGDAVKRIDFPVIDEGVIRLRPTRSGQPMEWAFITLADALDETLRHSPLLFSYRGGYELRGVRADVYKIGARDPASAAVWWYPGTADWDSAAAITLPEGGDIGPFEWEIPE